MIGDKHLNIDRETNGNAALNRLVWATASDLGYAAYFTRNTRSTEDDHIPFLAAGVEAVDLIDLDYPDATMRYWHTADDTLDKTAAASLQAVGDVLLAALPAIELRIK